MSERLKIAGMSIGGLVALITIVFVIGLAGLGYRMFFAPRQANIDRKVFEQTQSYTHGKIQDLSKYYNEYQKADDLIAKEAIKQLIIQQFAQFDSNKVINVTLRNFLVSTRGY